jgi:hypothetical protein
MATTQPASITTKDEFLNMTDGWLGVVELDHLGRAMGASVEPGGSCFLTEEEQILTANAPKDDKDNPFVNGALKLRTRAVEIRNRRPFGAPADEPSETGATPTPTGEPELGAAAAGEEVATPSATTSRRPRSK